MIRDISLIGLLLVVMMSCGRPADSYINHEKWHTNNLSKRPLAGSPREVKETCYIDLADTSLYASGTFKESWEYRFDPSGNTIFESVLFDNNHKVAAYVYYPAEGIRSKTIYYDSNGIASKLRNETIAEGIGKDKYKVTRYEDGKKTGHTFEAFSDSGTSVTREKWKNEKLQESVITIYRNERLVRTKRTANGYTTERLFHYARNGFLDSVTTQTDSISGHTIVFVNNEHGDPVLIIENNGRIRLKYQYDAKGNWVRQLVYNPYSMYHIDAKNKYPEYSLFVREINY